MSRGRLVAGLEIVFGLSVAVVAGEGDTVLLTPVQDNSMYSETVTNSNGAGQQFFAGRTVFGAVRRALLDFDVANSVPVGSTVTSARVNLRCSLNPPGGGIQGFTLHRLTADWGEGTSLAPGPGGTGAPAELGDATWDDRFFGMLAPWSVPGGDFVAVPSASFQVAGCSLLNPVAVTVPSNAQLVADVQDWLSNPTAEFGWILLGDEAVDKTARRFESREAARSEHRPQLIVEFLPPSAGGEVPNGDDVAGTPLTVGKLGDGRISLAWGRSCRASDQDYAVYEGMLGAFYSHDAVTCSTGGSWTTTLTPGFGAAYYLVVPVDPMSEEGSYGRASNGTERPQGTPGCFSQSITSPVCY